jgi:hypothetical protein
MSTQSQLEDENNDLALVQDQDPNQQVGLRLPTLELTESAARLSLFNYVRPLAKLNMTMLTVSSF